MQTPVGERWMQTDKMPSRDAQGNLTGIIGFAVDITERRRAEREREMAVEFLGLINASAGLPSLIRAATHFFCEQSGCEAVGVRLRDGDDFPYYETHGFPEEFVVAVNSLCCRDGNGQLQHDGFGNPVIACMCGNVISQRFDPAKPYFTSNGSFWTNSTTRLLATTTEADREARTRNRCNDEGYESVALIPLSAGEERLGLLQLNSKRTDRFTPELIALWERLGGYLAVAIAKARAEERLRESESFYRQTLESIPGMVFTTRPDGYCDYQSQPWVEFTGVPMQQHLGDGWNKLLHPDDRPRAFAAWRDAVEGRAPYDLEYRVRRRDGEYEWFKVRGRPIQDAAGQIVRWFGTLLNIEDLKHAEAQLMASLREKEVLLQEIHHRVKNNLQIISSLITLQVETFNQPALRAGLSDVRDRVRTMALVHEKLYQSGDLARLNFTDYATSLLHYLWRAHGDVASRVRLTVAAEPVTLPMTLAVPCGLILNELASNALKHAFPDRPSGEVTVGLTHDAASSQVCLRVSDDGVGLPGEGDWRESRSLGLRLVQMLTQQLHGTVEVWPGPGTEFRVAFPVKAAT
jgi:PAS domain S-box-containing protein